MGIDGGRIADNVSVRRKKIADGGDETGEHVPLLPPVVSFAFKSEFKQK